MHVYRRDTNYLDKVSPMWRKDVGTAKTVEWPTGIGVKGNEGLASYVQKTAGAIGYVEFAYALEHEMSHVQLENRDGAFVTPTIAAFQAAAANADWQGTPGFYVVLTDQPGEGSWPITGASFILLHRDQPRPELAREMIAFFDWCYRHGAQAAEALHYVPMPDVVVEQVRGLWKRAVSSGGKPVWP